MREGRGRLRLPGAGCGGREHDDLPRGFRRLRAAPLLPDDVQLRLVAAAERAGEGAPVQFGRREDLAALASSAGTGSNQAGRWLAATTATGLAVLAAEQGFERLRSCAAAGCDVVFVDTSRNHTRRFCSQACATRARVAAHRLRQRRG